jgi:hypothetical protein
MSQNNRHISNEAVRNGIGVALAAFESPSGEEIADTVAELVGNGNTEAYFVPAVRFLIDSTLQIVSEPEVKDALSNEVLDREFVASRLAEHVAKIATDNHVFSFLYKHSPTLSSISVPVVELDNLRNGEYLGSLGAAPFFDTRFVVGGAFRMLKAREIEDPKEVISRSSGLLVIAGVYKDPEIGKVVHSYLGLPYAKSEHYVLIDKEEGMEVAFADQAQLILETLHVEGRGCPAGKIKSPDNSPNRLLSDYWGKIVDFLIPAEATALR